MATVSDTIQVGGVRCERCVMRLGKVLEGVDGLESANAKIGRASCRERVFHTV